MQKYKSNKFENKFKRQGGLTLIELIITITLLAILLGIGVPSFVGTVQQNRAISTANEILHHLQLARSEAVRNMRVVRVCAQDSNSSSECGSDWGSGLLVVYYDDDADEDVVLRVASTSSNVTVSAVDGSNSPVAEIPFSPIGAINGAGAPYEFTVEAGNRSRLVCVRISGQSRVEESSC